MSQDKTQNKNRIVSRFEKGCLSVFFFIFFCCMLKLYSNDIYGNIVFISQDTLRSSYFFIRSITFRNTRQEQMWACRKSFCTRKNEINDAFICHFCIIHLLLGMRRHNVDGIDLGMSWDNPQKFHLSNFHPISWFLLSPIFTFTYARHVSVIVFVVVVVAVERYQLCFSAEVALGFPLKKILFNITCRFSQ